MATVRFSGELRDEIRTNARNTFDHRIKAADRVDDSIGDRIYAHVFEQYYSKMQALPDCFFTLTDQIHLNKFGEIDVERRIVFSKPMPFPKEYPANFKLRSSGWNITHVNYVYDPDNVFDVEMHHYFDTRREKLVNVIAQKDEFVDNVMKVCDSFTTLAPALKAWPPLWDLLPQHTKDRHLTVNERKSAAAKSAELLNEIDLSSMTANVVATKLVR